MVWVEREGERGKWMVGQWYYREPKKKPLSPPPSPPPAHIIVYGSVEGNFTIGQNKYGSYPQLPKQQTSLNRIIKPSTHETTITY